MGGVTTIASCLDTVAAFAEGGTDLLRNSEILSLDSHSIEADRMAAFPELPQLFGMALPAFSRKDHGLLLGGCLMVNVASDAMDPVLRMLGLHP